ncbi:MAG TPA: PQQ-dependent sugar dehydrogenase, partial [Acetobacteraceae bacterium]|nr:PQQ-dependent sugar dehydrogenase [Acetobacteraceae bacterium]
MASTVFLTNFEYRFSETVGVLEVTVSRTGSLEGDVILTYGLLGDTATAGADFVDNGFTNVVMPANTSTMTIPVTIINDAQGEATESLVFSLVNVQGATLFAPRTTRLYILDDETPAPAPPLEPPLVSDYDVVQVPLVSGLDSPTRIVASPSAANKFYVAGKNGTVDLVDVAAGTVQSVLDLRAKVNSYADRGLIDIVLHPDFAANPYLYVSASIDPPQTAGLTGEAGPDGAGNRYWQVLRYTLDASTGYTTILPGSEVVVLGKEGSGLADISGGGADDFTNPAYFDRTSSERTINPQDTTPPVVVDGFKQDYLKVDSASHMGGALAFGPDGMLYVSTGDGTSFNYADPRTPDVQSLSSLTGKILRVDPLTGRGLPDNPFVTQGMSLDLNQAKVFQYGLRNPYSMAFDSEGRLFVTDTGWNSYEEINTGGPGTNYGWPWYEGADGGTLSKPPGYRDFAQAASFYAAVEAEQIRVQSPYRAFSHDSAAPGFQVQAITGGEVVLNSGNYPTSLRNNYIFTDFVQGEVYTANVTDSLDVRFLFQASGFAPIDFIQGPNGSVYYADLVRGEIGRLDITTRTTPPPPPPPPPPSGGAVSTTIGTGPDALVLRISQDAFQGSAQYTIAVDGVQQGGIQTAGAL